MTKVWLICNIDSLYSVCNLVEDFRAVPRFGVEWFYGGCLK
jgi:hypothetical protein